MNSIRPAAPLDDPFYYLANFRFVLEWVSERHGDLLNVAERDFMARCVALPQASQALLVRMVMRKGEHFRVSRLFYAEIGAFIATLGLPPADAFQEALRARLQARFGRGEDYAYRVPGLVKVIQAAGRVIRGPEDRGVVVLMDDRFAQPEVCHRLPGWWRVVDASSGDERSTAVP